MIEAVELSLKGVIVCACAFVVWLGLFARRGARDD